jgi:hypothetical protein
LARKTSAHYFSFWIINNGSGHPVIKNEKRALKMLAWILLHVCVDPIFELVQIFEAYTI